ncbi:hypothetical protein AVEN_8374-1 [Araneus ventricosus]|uniref:Uncharacterized protein n=1 Tax=Araneus ventricosus TaxID=182803 RepID=A0A4Y2SEY1_ARAVE|nr:hypothetical protein AVEN_8374-1 [Araneus ventricosus]
MPRPPSASRRFQTRRPHDPQQREGLISPHPHSNPNERPPSIVLFRKSPLRGCRGSSSERHCFISDENCFRDDGMGWSEDAFASSSPVEWMPMSSSHFSDSFLILVLRCAPVVQCKHKVLP